MVKLMVDDAPAPDAADNTSGQTVHDASLPAVPSSVLYSYVVVEASADEECICKDVYAPVCTVDSKVYDNKCLAKCL